MDAHGLPEYTESTRGHTQHSYTLKDASVGVAVTLYSYAASPKSQPMFHNEATVAGTIALMLPKKQSVQSVVVKVVGVQRGHSWVQGRDELIFLELTTEIWAGKEAKSLASAATHTKSFALTLPREFKSASKKAQDQPFALPPSFVAQGFPEYLIYEMRCIIKKGRFAQDDILKIPLRYLPECEAGAPSSLRMLAYEDNSPILGPDVDVVGWATTRFVLPARVFAKRDVQIDFSFSLPTPLQYAKRFPIPYAIAVESTDTQALDLISSSFKTLPVALMRHYHISEDVAEAAPDLVGKGRHWLVASTPTRRTFMGELPVLGQLSPGFHYPRLSLCYKVAFSVNAPGLVLQGDNPRYVVPVEITTRPAPGPLPVSYAPPMRPEEEAPVTDVSNSHSANAFRITQSTMLSATQFARDLTV